MAMCSRGKVEEVRAALGRGVDVNTRDRMGLTGLMLAAICDQEEVVEVLLAHPGVDVNCRDSMGTALHLACRSWRRSSVGIVRRLLAMPGVQVDAKDVTGR